MKCILIDEIENEPKVVDVGNTLKDWYKAMNCDIVTSVYRYIGREQYCIMADDEGLLSGKLPVTVDLNRGEVVGMLVGSILITGLPDEVGECTDLTDEDIKNILNPKNYRAFMLERNDIPYLRRLLFTNVA